MENPNVQAATQQILPVLLTKMGISQVRVERFEKFKVLGDLRSQASMIILIIITKNCF